MSFEIKPTPSINAAIGDLVASAPAALDTLNELAAALNDDANFAATVTNQIANKLDKTTPTLNLLGTLLSAPGSANYGDVYKSAADDSYYMWDGDSWNSVKTSFITAIAPSSPMTSGTYTIDSNTEEYIDIASGEGAFEYTIRLKQGGKMRTSKVIVNYISGPPPLSDFTEFGIIETGGSISGVSVSTMATMIGAAIGITVTGASPLNSVDVKFSKVAL